MNILLLGHKGYLGSYLYRHLSVDTLDETVRTLYSNNKTYDYVINCIGKPNLEYCEDHVDETNYSNHLIVRDIKRYYPTAKIINFSSYYVYDDEGLCTENSKTTDKYQYCRQNVAGEQEVTNGVSFRLGKLFGNPEIMQYKLTEYILSNDHLVLDSVYFNPLSVQQVLRVIIYELEQHTLSGVYNIANQGVISPYEYGRFINTYLGTNKHIEKIEKATRMFHNYGKFLMSVEKLSKIIPLTPWQEDMREYLKEITPSLVPST